MPPYHLNRNIERSQMSTLPVEYYGLCACITMGSATTQKGAYASVGRGCTVSELLCRYPHFETRKDPICKDPMFMCGVTAAGLTYQKLSQNQRRSRYKPSLNLVFPHECFSPSSPTLLYCLKGNATAEMMLYQIRAAD